MGKAPAFQFYVKDWLSDSQLRMASPLSRGVWIDLLCYMWDAPERGELTGTKESLCRLLGTTDKEFDAFYNDAITYSFCDISVTDNGTITLRNRRMWRDEKDRNNNRLRQQRHREKRNDNVEITPPSPSPSPSPNKKLTASGDAVDGQKDFLITKKGRKFSGNRYQDFSLFWEAFNYKRGKAESADAWLAIPDYTSVLVGKIIESAKLEDRNRPSLIAQGKTPKMAQGWLSGRRWEDETQTPSQESHQLTTHEEIEEMFR